jgi:hypothetical protein
VWCVWWERWQLARRGGGRGGCSTRGCVCSCVTHSHHAARAGTDGGTAAPTSLRTRVRGALQRRGRNPMPAPTGSPCLGVCTHCDPIAAQGEATPIESTTHHCPRTRPRGRASPPSAPALHTAPRQRQRPSQSPAPARLEVHAPWAALGAIGSQWVQTPRHGDPVGAGAGPTAWHAGGLVTYLPQGRA